MTWRRAIDGALALLFALPLASLWTEPTASVTLKFLAAAVLFLTAVRPAIGLCLVAAVLPISPALHATMPAAAIAREAQALALALLTAGFARLAFAPRPAEPGRLALPALVLGSVIVGRAVIFTAADLADLSFFQTVAAIGAHLTREYFVPQEMLVDLHRAFAWIVSLALAVLVERMLRTERAATVPVIRLAIAGATAAAGFTIFRTGQLVVASGDVPAALGLILNEFRFSPFLADLNATGSLILLYLIPAAWIAITRRQSLAWAAATLLAGALWLTGSRAAILAAFGGAAAAGVMARRIPRRWWVGALVVVIGAAALAVWSTRPRRATVADALTIRWNMGIVGLKAAATDPLLGIGVDRLRTESAPFITPEFARMWPPAKNGENAHNNFVQVLAESGVLGLAAFLWLLSASVGAGSRWRADAANDEFRPGIAGGLVAFLLTSLSGHPLLVETVRLGFFFWIGCLAAGPSTSSPSPVGAGRRRAAMAMAAAAVILVILVVPRAVSARRNANLVGATVRVGAVVGRVDGVLTRPAGQASAWIIAPEATAVEWTLRADFGSPRPCRVEIEVDRQPALAIELDDTRWRPVKLSLPPPANPGVPRRLDVLARTYRCAVLTGPMQLR